MPNQPEASIDYDRLMRANLASVFNERDAGTRIRAIRELYAESAVLYEPPDTAAEGHAAISEAVTHLLASLPPNFAFTATGPALGHHGIGRLRWQAGPPDGPVAVNGMDIARFQDGRILSLHVFIEPTA
ncbi:MAG: nuclear transport factor 2 family protein [Beijerinckiaceae bacterium]